MRGDSFKLKALIKEYGSEFCVDAIQKAAEVKEAGEMLKKGRHIKTMNKRESEARILMMANDMRVRLLKK